MWPRRRAVDEAAASEAAAAIGEAAAAIREALVKATARRPRARYFVPFSARLQSSFLGALPERVLDRILLKLYKVPSPGA